MAVAVTESVPVAATVSVAVYEIEPVPVSVPESVTGSGIAGTSSGLPMARP